MVGRRLEAVTVDAAEEEEDEDDEDDDEGMVACDGTKCPPQPPPPPPLWPPSLSSVVDMIKWLSSASMIFTGSANI